MLTCRWVFANEVTYIHTHTHTQTYVYIPRFQIIYLPSDVIKEGYFKARKWICFLGRGPCPHLWGVSSKHTRVSFSSWDSLVIMLTQLREMRRWLPRCPLLSSRPVDGFLCLVAEGKVIAKHPTPPTSNLRIEEVGRQALNLSSLYEWVPAERGAGCFPNSWLSPSPDATVQENDPLHPTFHPPH